MLEVNGQPIPWEVLHDHGDVKPIGYGRWNVVVHGEAGHEYGSGLTFGSFDSREEAMAWLIEKTDEAAITQGHRSVVGLLGDCIHAIQARIKGEYDHPALMAYGPLSTEPTSDVLGIISHYENRIKEKELRDAINPTN